jgi:hypothetical protein
MECRVLALLFPTPTGVVVAILVARNYAVNQAQRSRLSLRQFQRPAALAVGYPLPFDKRWCFFDRSLLINLFAAVNGSIFSRSHE